MKYSVVTGALVAAMVMMLSVGALALQVGDPPPTFSLDDQFRKHWDLAGAKNMITVVVAANPDSGRNMGPWFDNLKSKYGTKIQVLGLMDLHTVPGIGRGFARNRIKNETKDPLMLDFNGSTAKAYSVNAKNPVVVVIGKDSLVKAIQKNAYSTANFAPITSAIDSELKK